MDERTWCPLVTDEKDLEVLPNGDTEKDFTVASRCRVRLTAHLGKWCLDPTLGSRFFELKRLRDARTKARDYAQQALAPLVLEGAILGVEVGQAELDAGGMLGVEVLVKLPGETDAVSIGTFGLGG
jgi:phage gp46-like protein